MTDLTQPGEPAGSSNASPTVHFGGMLGMAACAIGLAIFLAGCFGMNAVFSMAIIPLLMSATGMVFTVVGGVLRKGGVEHTGILAGLFVNLFGLVGGFLELAVAQNWAIFPKAAG
jgi:hypothetical protein